MKKKINRTYKKIVGSVAVALCMTVALLFAMFQTEATDSKKIRYNKATYTKDNTAPETPEGYLFAGWYTSEDETNYTPIKEPVLNTEYYAKFVPEEVLDIKAQISSKLLNETNNVPEAGIRFVTSIDDTTYKQIGFNIQKGPNAEAKDAEVTNYVYKTLYAVDATSASEDAKLTEYTPSMFHEQSQYFKTWTITKVPDTAYNTDITVIPYWITLDGTRVEGTKAIKTVNLGRSWIYVDATAHTDGKAYGTYDHPYTELSQAVTFANGFSEKMAEPKLILKDDISATETMTVTRSMKLTNVDDVTVTDAAGSAGTLISVAANANLTVATINDTIITFDGNDTSETVGNRLVSIQADGALKLENVHIKNIYNSLWGTALHNSGTLDLLEGCVLENNSGAAGTIYNAGILTDNGTTYHGNTARSNHGGAVVNDGIATFTGCSFSNNVTVSNNGGAVANRINEGSVAQLSMKDCTFTSNKAESSHGGAVWSQGTKHEMTNCSFDGNIAKNGGALYITMGNAGFTGTDCVFKNNSTTSDSAYGAGAAMFTGGNTATLTNTNVDNGVYDYAKACFIGNENNGGSGIYGGAVVVWTNTILDITGYKFDNNSARAGAAVYVHVDGDNVGTLKDTNGYYSNNVGNVNAGGAIRNSGVATFDGTTFEGNKIADGVNNDGGAIYTNGPELTCKNVTFSNNTADGKGGAVYINPNTTSAFESCQFEGDDNTVQLATSSDKGQAEIVLTGKTSGMKTAYSSNAVGLLIGDSFDSTSNITILPNEYQLDVQVVGTVEGAEGSLSTAANSFAIPKDEYNYTWNVDANGCLQAPLPYATIGEDDSKVEYESLNAAIQAANDNDVIIIWRDNTMNEAVSLDKSITITNVRNVKVVDGRNEGTTSGNLFTIQDGKTLAIMGAQQSIITIDGADTSEKMGDRLVAISAGGTLTLQNVNMKNAYVDRWGAAISNSGTLNLQGGCTFENNSGNTGAIYNAGSLTDIGTVYRNNTARSQYGGAVHNVGVLNITDCVYENNTSSKAGAAIFNSGTLNDTGCTYENNTSSANAGGAIRNEGKATFTGSTFINNSQAANDGGAIYSTGSQLEMTSCTFDGNSAKNGGALYINLTDINSAGNTFVGTNCIFENNSVLSNSTYGAGAVMFTGTGTATLTNTAVTDGVYDYTKAYFSNNSNKSTSVNGGAIVVYHANTILNMTGYKFSDNTACGGAAIYVKGTLNDNASVYEGNMASSQFGGAVYNVGALTNNGTVYRNNTADAARGGAVYNASDATKAVFIDSLFENNKSEKADGGAVYSYAKEHSMTNCTFNGNSAKNGGAIYIDTDNASFTGTNCVFDGNSVNSSSDKGGGAAAFVGSGTVILTNNTVKEGVYDYTKAYFTNNKNKATGAVYGGAIFVNTGVTLNLTGYKLANNEANGGGAVRVLGILKDESNIYSGNVARAASGGAIRIDSALGKTSTFKNSEFYGNISGDDGGAICVASAGSITANDCTFGRIVDDVNEGNSSKRGGAIYHNNPTTGNYGSSTYVNCKFVGNTTTGIGPHLAVKACTLTDCTFESPNESDGVINSW